MELFLTGAMFGGALCIAFTAAWHWARTRPTDADFADLPRPIPTGPDDQPHAITRLTNRQRTIEI